MYSLVLQARVATRLRRCRVVFPEDASNELTPDNAAKAAFAAQSIGIIVRG
jgi:hypothetical protein